MKTYIDGSRAHSTRLPSANQRALPQKLLGVMRIRKSCQRALRVVDLVKALMREEYSLIIRA
jgi:hypothetical protein